MPGFAVEVPNQDNAIDCGVFVLKYVVQFCLCPPQDFSSKQTINNELGRFWFPISDIPKLRLSIQHTINQLINNNNTTSADDNNTNSNNNHFRNGSFMEETHDLEKEEILENSSFFEISNKEKKGFSSSQSKTKIEFPKKSKSNSPKKHVSAGKRWKEVKKKLYIGRTSCWVILMIMTL